MVVSILKTQLMILIIIIIGFCVTKAGLLSQKTRSDITDLVLYIILPCNIFSAFHKGVSPEVLRQSIVVLIAAFGMQLIYMILNRILYNRIPQERRIVLQYATITNNAGFMGLPVIESVFGQTGLLYGAIVLIPLRIFMWTAGLSLFTKADKKQRIKIVATHPCIWAVLLGFAYLFVPFELPVFISDMFSFIGGSVTLLTMLIVGSILSEVNPKDVIDKDCFFYSFIRLIAIPAVLYCALTLLRIDHLATGVIVLSSAMPAAVMTAMLADKYGKDSAFASKTVFVSTIISMVTLPIIAVLLTQGVR